ncbi:tyrosine-type recombinase/integrase [Streptomyces mirabilis]
MTTIRQHAQDYLAMRRRLGFTLTTFGEKLMSFIDYLEDTGDTVLTTRVALAWATNTPRSTDEVHWSRRLMVVRIFARHLKALEPATEIPPDDALPHHYRRITPHLFTPDELDRLLAATGTLNPPFRARTWHTFLGLLAVSGLRTSEACGLDRTHVDLAGGVLTVRETKFGKSRQVPVHATTVTALRRYAQERDLQRPAPSTAAFLVSTRGTRLDSHNLPRAFVQLLAAAGITAGQGRRRPRLHDLRHTFATTTLLQWYQGGEDVQAKLPLLTTYLGHADPKSTYWYLSGSPELLSLAAARLEHSFGGRP